MWELSRFKFLIIITVLLIDFSVNSSDCNAQKNKKASCPEKWWVVFHPFVAKKVYKISQEARIVTEKVKNDSVLIGTGNAQQIDAFRHTYWMATLTQKIGSRKAKKLGEAHEKGNYKDFKKRKNEEGVIPDEISSEMDLYNNSIGIKYGESMDTVDFEKLVIEVVKKGECKIIKTDKFGNYLDKNGNMIPPETLKGKWKNDKCLVNSDKISF